MGKLAAAIDMIRRQQKAALERRLFGQGCHGSPKGLVSDDRRTIAGNAFHPA
jgi:hypothetical protein